MAEPIEHDEITWIGRTRAVLLLAALVAALGLLTAVTTGVLLVALTSLVDQALG